LSESRLSKIISSQLQFSSKTVDQSGMTLSLNDFSKSYSGNLIIAIKDLTFTPGIYWIKGENGSGKTTLFKSLAGLHPCQGKISFSDGINLHTQPVAYRRLVNYAEAEPVYPGFLTGKDLFYFVGKAKDMAPEQTQLIHQLGLDRYYENPCDTYSSGMLKKLSISLAFLGNPRLIILDEPLITLDEKARQLLFELIHQSVVKETIIMISSHQAIEHDQLPISKGFAIKNKTLQEF
jgi:ABC-2 type transport system ATP-binding protein